MKTAVIGGGIAGLVAAHELIKAGYRPILIEPAQIGGMIRSSTVDGYTLEQGPNVLVERPDMKNLLAQLGLHQAAATNPVLPGRRRRPLRGAADAALGWPYFGRLAI